MKPSISSSNTASARYPYLACLRLLSQRSAIARGTSSSPSSSWPSSPSRFISFLPRLLRHSVQAAFAVAGIYMGITSYAGDMVSFGGLLQHKRSLIRKAVDIFPYSPTLQLRRTLYGSVPTQSGSLPED